MAEIDPREWKEPEIKERELTKYHWLVLHKENLLLGKYTDLGAFTLLEASEGILIEDKVKIGSHCSIYSRTDSDNKKGKVTLKEGCALGSHCVVMPGVTIGKNALVGAMSFVNKDIPANEIWVGSPARFLKRKEEEPKAEASEEQKIIKNENNPWKVPLFKTKWYEDDLTAVEKVLRRGTSWAAGPEIQEFERALAKFTGRKYAVACNSGTSALQLMYQAIGIKEKEVIVPSFTFVATANAVIAAGGIPVFAESEAETFGLDAEDVRRKITPNTAAIVALHYAGGVSRDIEKLQKIAQEHNLVLLEDNAHSLGVLKNGKMCGTFGEAAALSFCQNKLITTGEGGAVITDSQELYEKMKLLCSHGRVESQAGDYFSHTGDNDYVEVGYNFRMPTMNAALGLSQLQHFQETMRLRIEAATTLNKDLSQIPEIKTPAPYQNSNHFYQMYTIMLPTQEIRDALQNYLAAQGIMSKVYYQPVHLKTLYQQK